MKDIRVAIIGQGRSGRDIHGKYFKSELNEFFDVVAVVETDAQRRERALTEYPGCTVYSDYKELYARDDIDVVVNATFSEDHYRISKELLSNGKNVLVEKPMGKTRWECEDLMTCAKKNGVTIAVFQQSFFAPYYVFAKDVIASGKLGDVFQIDVKFNGFSRRWDWQTLQCKTAGGLYNTGPHPVGLALGFLDFDEHTEVKFSRLGKALTSGDGDDYAKIILTAPGKPVLDVEVNSADGYPQSTVKIMGTKGTLRINVAGEYNMKYIVDGENPERPVIFEFLKNEEGLPMYCSEKLNVHEESGALEGNVFTVGTNDFYKTLREKLKNGTKMPIGPEHAMQVISVIEQVWAQNPLPILY